RDLEPVGERVEPRGGHEQRGDDDLEVAHAPDSRGLPPSPYGSCRWPRTVRQDCHVMRRITSVMARPMSASATGAPSATTAADAITPRLTYASARAWLPSAMSAGLSIRRPVRVRTSAAISLPT